MSDKNEAGREHSTGIGDFKSKVSSSPSMNVGYAAAARFQVPIIQQAKTASLVSLPFALPSHDGFISTGLSGILAVPSIAAPTSLGVSNVPGQIRKEHEIKLQISNPNGPVTIAAEVNSISQSQEELLPHGRNLADTAQTVNYCGITRSVTDSVLNALNIENNQQGHSRFLNTSSKGIDENKVRAIRDIVESTLDETTKQQIAQILDQVSVLNPIAQLLLYLRLPTGTSESDPLRQPQNPLGTRSEIRDTITWVRTHLEHDPQVSIPKMDVYNDYLSHCERLNIKPLSTADFGKVMKQVFPFIRPRRLGTRGNSRYCYAAMRKTTKLSPPQLPVLARKLAKNEQETNDKTKPALCEDEVESWEIVKSWSENILHIKVNSLNDLAQLITERNLRSVTKTKKYPSSREVKEKQPPLDVGPLKKRRKKKRKVSTSSESDSNTNLTRSETAKSECLCSPSHVVLDVNTKKEIEVKQEISDSPSEHHTVQAVPLPLLVSNSAHYYAKASNYQQLMPMNLATEARNLSNKTSPGSIDSSVTTNLCRVVRNITPKLVCVTSLDSKVMCNSSLELKKDDKHKFCDSKDASEDYDISKTLCKKVLKAQQTKGFWTNSPVNVNNNNNTVTAACASPTSTNAIENSSNSTSFVSAAMGPPTQILADHSVSPEATGPKVLSRNAQQLQLLKEFRESESVDQLGFSRERLISILQMDKHEMDSYLLQSEREITEGADSELSEIFPTDDPDEKTLDTPENIGLISAGSSTNDSQEITSIGSDISKTTVPLITVPRTQAVNSPSVRSVSTAVGSASASLVLMSQKHQQQQQLSAKRKESSQLNSLQKKREITTKNKRQTPVTTENSKSFIFCPITRNSVIENAPTSATGFVCSNDTNSSCFASPHISNIRSKIPILTKHSLQADNENDPMIGAERTKRSYVASAPPNSSTSAPPSPSTYQHFNNLNFWSSIDQNGIDFDNNLPALTSDVTDVNIALSSLGENQRSQSVPLSQLQRAKSPNLVARRIPGMETNFTFNADLECGPNMANGVTTFFTEKNANQRTEPKLIQNSENVTFLDDVGVFSPKFDNIAHAQNTAMTCSPSAGSSSGYCSSIYNNCANIVSRSVPTTPLPHHQHGTFSTGSFYSRHCGNEMQPSPTMQAIGADGMPFRRRRRHDAESFGSRTIHDLSKSMPTTPITTPCFRYSPSETERHRDFLINGNTVDSFASSTYGVGTDGSSRLLRAATDSLPGLDSLSTQTLIDDSAVTSNSNDEQVDAIIAEQDLLGNL